MPPSPGFINGTHSTSEAGSPAYGSGETLRPSIYTRGTTSSSHARAEHVYSLINGKGKPWVSLRFQSAAHASTNVPVFWEGDTITGTLNLEVYKAHIVQIDIVATGRIVTSVEDYDSNIFLNLTQTVMSRTDKLDGPRSWPFSLAIPRQVTAMSKSGSPQTFYLPPTFLERNTRVSVQYDIFVRIRRGRLRPDNRVGTIFAYVPSIQPGPPSLLRQLAYRHGSRILGPNIDPEGWKILEPIHISGTIFNRPIRAMCTLSLANPLCYTKGTAIPCALLIETVDEQALDLLSSPRAPNIHLQRRVTYSSILPSQRTHAVGKEQSSAIDYPSTATFWPGPPCDEPRQRRLDGEIQLSPHLKPSCSIMHFSIAYHVVMFPFEAITFQSADRNPLLAEKVDIGTLFAHGPKPKLYSPPNYSDSSSKYSQFTVTGASVDFS